MLIPILLLCVFSLVLADRNRHGYGRLVLHGAVNNIEVFRATFGGYFPCGSYEIVPVSQEDPHFCTEPLDSRFRGRYVLARRGECPFYMKALNAQKGGAMGLLVLNNEYGLMRVGWGNATLPVPILLPIVMIPNATAVFFDTAARLNATYSGALLPTRDLCVKPKLVVLNWTETFVPARGEYYEAEWTHAEPKVSHILSDDSSTCASAYNITYNGTYYDSSGLPSSREVLDEMLQQGTGDSMSAEAVGNLTEAARLTFLMPLGDGVLGERTAEELAHLTTVASSQREAVAALFSGPIVPAAIEVTVSDPLDACSSLNGTEAAYRDKIVIVLRGGCSMINKTRIVQAHGSIGIIIVNQGIDVNMSLGEIVENTTNGTTLEAESAVQAIPDDHLKKDPVHIMAFMVSARSALGWLWRRADGTLGDIRGMRMRLHPTVAKGDAWEELSTLAAQGTRLVPEDEYHRKQWLIELLQHHHPDSPLGDQARMQFLHRLLVDLSLAEELGAAQHAFLQSMSGRQAPHAVQVVPISTKGRRAPPFSNQHVWSAFLSKHSNTRYLSSSKLDWLSCAVDSGTTYIFRQEEIDISSTADTAIGKLQEALRQQACLERLVLRNAARIGTLLALLRRDTPANDWMRVLMTLLRPHGWSRNDAHNFTNAFVDSAEYVAALDGADEMKIQEWISSLAP